MFFNSLLVFAAISTSAFLNANAHGTITAVTGANGIDATGFGIIASTPRDGSTPNPFEQDTSIIRNNEIKSGKTGVCGRTKAGGNNDVATQLAAASAAGLPSAAADGSVTMTLHQVNGDGAGPYTCDVSGDGGNTFQAATVTQQVPGKNGLSRARATNFTLVAQLPAGMACTAGPNGDACLLRCRNPALAGPFGGCVAVSNGSGNSTAAAATAAATAAAASTDTAAAAASAAATDAATASAASTETAAAAAVSAAAATDAAAAAADSAATTAASATEDAVVSKKAAKKAAKKAKAAAAAKRHIISRIAGKRSGYWLDNDSQ